MMKLLSSASDRLQPYTSTAWLFNIERLVIEALNSPLLLTILLVLYTLILYSPALDSAFLNRDDLVAVSVIRTGGPWVGLGQDSGGTSPWFENHLFRPLFPLQVWTLHRLFGVNYAGHQAVLLLLFCFVAIVFFRLLLQLALQPPPAALLATLFISHFYINPLVLWVSDTAVLQYGLVGLASLLFLKSSHRLWDYVLLTTLLFMALLARENGLAFIGATAVLATVKWYKHDGSRRRAALLFLCCLVSLVVYFLLRHYSVGLFPGKLPPEDAGFFFSRYSPADLAAFSPQQRLLLSLYTMGANLLATFLPIVRGNGYLGGTSWRILGLSTLLFAAVSIIAHQWRPRFQHWSSMLFLTGLLAISMIALLLIDSALVGRSVFDSLEIGQLVLHGLLSLILVALLLSDQKRLRSAPAVAYGLTLIMGGAAIAFAYFRYRNLYPGFIGWLLLLTTALKARPLTETATYLRRYVPFLIACAVVVNSLLLFTALPEPALRAENQQGAVQTLCDPQVSSQVAEGVAVHYDIPMSEVIRCRESNAE